MGSMKEKRTEGRCPQCGAELIAKRQSAWLPLDMVDALHTLSRKTGCSTSFLIRKAILDLPDDVFLETTPQGQKAISFTMDDDSLSKALALSQTFGIGISGVARFALMVNFKKGEK